MIGLPACTKAWDTKAVFWLQVEVLLVPDSTLNNSINHNHHGKATSLVGLDGFAKQRYKETSSKPTAAAESDVDTPNLNGTTVNVHFCFADGCVVLLQGNVKTPAT